MLVPRGALTSFSVGTDVATNTTQIYGANYPRLRLIKTKYDPRGRFNKGVFIPPYLQSSCKLLQGISAKL